MSKLLHAQVRGGCVDLVNGIDAGHPVFGNHRGLIVNRADLGDANSVDIAPEQIIASDPEIIIFTASPQTDIDNNVVLGYGCDEKKALSALEAYKDRTGWASLSAVKNNRMGALYHDLSRHIFDFAGAQFLAKQIQPELFADLDPQAVLAEFFEKFMPVELEGAWMIAL